MTFTAEKRLSLKTGKSTILKGNREALRPFSCLTALSFRRLPDGTTRLSSSGLLDGCLIPGLCQTVKNELKEKQPFYEVRIQELLLHLWLILLKHGLSEGTDGEEKGATHSLAAKHSMDEKNYERIRQMLSYIQENYAQKLELEEISHHVHICKANAAEYLKVT